MSARGVELAIEKVGSASELARRLGLKPAAVLQWKAVGVPVKRVPAVSKVTGLSEHELRPDFWPKPGAAA